MYSQVTTYGIFSRYFTRGMLITFYTAVRCIYKLTKGDRGWIGLETRIIVDFRP